MQVMGQDGYMEVAGRLMEVTKAMVEGVRSLEVRGEGKGGRRGGEERGGREGGEGEKGGEGREEGRGGRDQGGERRGGREGGGEGKRFC